MPFLNFIEAPISNKLLFFCPENCKTRRNFVRRNQSCCPEKNTSRWSGPFISLSSNFSIGRQVEIKFVKTWWSSSTLILSPCLLFGNHLFPGGVISVLHISGYLFQGIWSKSFESPSPFSWTSKASHRTRWRFCNFLQKSWRYLLYHCKTPTVPPQKASHSQLLN